MDISLEWGYVITAVVSVVISSVIANIIYTRNKRTDFEYDYRRYILEKRKAAYDKVEYILRLTSSFHYIPQLQSVIPGVFMDGDSLANYRSHLRTTLHDGFWLSVELKNLLHKILNEDSVIEDDPEVPVYDHDIVDYGISQADAFREFDITLKALYFRDICQLDQIEAFRKKVTS